MVPVNMPVVGQDIPTGIIKEWLKEEGEAVSREEIIAIVESEKATFDVEAPAEGILLKKVRQEDEEVNVLTPIAYIGEKGEAFEIAKQGHEAPQEMEPASQAGSTPEAVSPVSATGTKLFISPLARKIAEEEGIEVESVAGTGPNGRIIKRNVLEAIEKKKASHSAPKESVPVHVSQPDLRLPLWKGEKEIPFDRMRRLIADKLTLSKQTVPHFYLFSEVEMDQAILVKEQLKAERNIHVTITDIVLHAVARAMSEFPRMSSHVFPDRYVLLRDVNIGLAVSSDDGLRVPVITHADKSDLAELSVRTKQLSANARNGKIDPGLKAGLTVSTLGMYGIPQFLPIINPPECAILAVGKSSPKVVTDGTAISIKKMMTITLACDHRLIDGAYAASFLGRAKEILQQADFRKLNW